MCVNVLHWVQVIVIHPPNCQLSIEEISMIKLLLDLWAHNQEKKLLS